MNHNNVRTYQFLRHDGNGNVIESETRRFIGLRYAEEFGFKRGYDEMIVKSTYNQKP